MVKLPSPRATPKTPTRKKEREIVTLEAWDRIITRFPYGHSCYVPLMLAYRCGLRLGEAYAVMWDDIDFENGILKVKRQQDRARLYYNEYYTHLYENSEHQIVSEGDETCEEIRLINVRENGTYIQPRTMQHCSRIIHYELGYMNFDFHSLRHTHTTMPLENGANIKDVQHRLGHKNIQVTLEIYAHLTERMQDRSVEILNQLPVDNTRTPNLPEKVTETVNFITKSARFLPQENTEKTNEIKGLQQREFEVGVQNCTLDKILGYKRGTNHVFLP